MLKYKIVLAGAKNVGKSSLIARFCDNIFDEHMMDTIGVAFKRKHISVTGEEIELNIWDFGGEEKYRGLFPSYVQGASGALILYDLTRKETVNDILNWVRIIDANPNDIVKVLIGTKCDLVNERQVSKEQSQEVCKDFNFCEEAIETSAKTGENVEKAFLRVCETILNQKLVLCKSCGKRFSKKLKFCQYCGAKA
jgi:small GTP-binding protein